MGKEDATEYRSTVSRVNFLAQDRPDIIFAAKEASRVMTKPEAQDWERLERMSGYLKENPRLVYKYELQNTGSLLQHKIRIAQLVKQLGDQHQADL